MADCDNILTLTEVEETTQDARVLKEVLTSTQDETERQDSSGNTHITLKGIENLAQSNVDQAISDFNTEANQAISDFNTEAQNSLDSFDANQASAIAAAGYNVVGNFIDGATLTQLGDAIYYAGTDPDNSDFSYAGFYAWTGTFPKVVSAGSHPITESGWQLAATGYVKQSGAIQLFGQVIDQDFNIPVGQNALSINAETADGVTVTIPAGSTYITIGDIE